MKRSLIAVAFAASSVAALTGIVVAKGEAAKDALAHGLNIMVFPEGTRSPDGKLLPFKKGAFFLAADTGAPIVPVIISGTTGMMPKGSLKIVPGVAEVRFLPVVEPTDYASREELMVAVRGEMERALGE